MEAALHKKKYTPSQVRFIPSKWASLTLENQRNPPGQHAKIYECLQQLNYLTGITAKNWKQPRCRSRSECTNKYGTSIQWGILFIDKKN